MKSCPMFPQGDCDVCGFSNTIYICSAFKNRDINTELTNRLEREGFNVFNPERDSNQDSDSFYQSDLLGIRKSTLVIFVIGHIGYDFCFELGYIKALDKKASILLLDPLKQDRSMVNIAINSSPQYTDIDRLISSLSLPCEL